MQTLKSKLFWTLSIIAVAIIFTVFYNSNKTFVGETQILLLPKSDATSRNIEQIIANARVIPKSLSFYNAMLTENSDIEDGAAQLPDAQRKIYWDSKINIDRIGRSGILEISVFDKSPMQAQIISEQTAADIAVVLSRYYNIKTELDVRFTEGTIVSNTVPVNFWSEAVAASVVLGFILGAAIANIIFSLQRKREVFYKEKIESIFRFRKTEEEMVHKPEPKKEIKIEEPVKPAAKKVPPISSERKAAAPFNLPIGEGSEIKTGTVSFAPGEGKQEKADHTREATAEEVKERLNKLLKGNF